MRMNRNVYNLLSTSTAHESLSFNECSYRCQVDMPPAAIGERPTDSPTVQQFLPQSIQRRIPTTGPTKSQDTVPTTSSPTDATRRQLRRRLPSLLQIGHIPIVRPPSPSPEPAKLTSHSTPPTLQFFSTIANSGTDSNIVFRESALPPTRSPVSPPSIPSEEEALLWHQRRPIASIFATKAVR